MRSTITLRSLMLLLVLAMLAGACAAEEGGDDEADTGASEAAADTGETADPAAQEDASEAMATEEMATEMTEDAGATDAAVADSTQACDTDAIVEAVEGGAEEGTLDGMTDDPVGTAASNNPVLTTLTAAVTEAGLVDTLNTAEALTVFAPTDCAFAALDPATLDAALADPTGLLTTVLGFHVIPGEQIASADLSGEYTTFTGETLTVEGDMVAGQAQIVVPDIQTANATVHLIDSVMLPPSASGGAEAGATEAG